VILLSVVNVSNVCVSFKDKVRDSVILLSVVNVSNVCVQNLVIASNTHKVFDKMLVAF